MARVEDAYFNPGVRLILCRAEVLRQWRHANLSAPYWRLYWNRKPGGFVTLDGHTTPLDPHHLVLIPPDTPFAARSTGETGHLYVHFLAQAPYAGLAPAVFRIPIDAGTSRRTEDLFERTLGGTPLDERAVMLAFSLIHQALSAVPPECLRHHVADTRIQAAIRLMGETPQAPPDNARLARAAGLSPNAFIRLFKRRTGQSPQSFAMARRVEQACLLLHNSPLGIKEIAERTGFSDRYHFTRVFTRLRGISPAAFRRRTYAPAAGSFIT